MRADLHRGMRRLTGDDRSVLVLRYALDLTQEKVAQWLGVPEGTAKVRLHRARMRLHSVLLEER
jgi:RNA polymerase sigma-70 factor (ECF subfamily)